MRRLVTGTYDYLRELAASAARGWNRFFFTPADPTPLGLIRVVVGLILLWNYSVYALDLHNYFASDGWSDPTIIQNGWRDLHRYAWSLWFYVPDDMLWPAWCVCMGVFTLFTLGLWSRVIAFAAWAIVISTARRAPVAQFGFDQIISGWMLYLAFCGASGRAVSLDRFLARWKESRAAASRKHKEGRFKITSGVPEPSTAANIGLRLIQLHLCLIYAAAGLSKLQGGAWWNGTAIWSTIAAREFQYYDVTWLARYPILINLMTHISLALEIVYPVLIWIPRLRPLLVAGVIALHAGIGLTMGLNEFGVAMIAGNLAFFSAIHLRSLVTGRKQPAGRVLYDGACPRCRASIALFAAADPDRVVEPVDLTAVDVATIHPSLTREACLRSMHLVRSDGRVRVGYDAVMTILSWLPLFWPASLARFVPGAGFVGRRVYQKIADSRPRDVACTDDSCAIHAPSASLKEPAASKTRS
ncbi:MAG: DUF393 domain-containing protein [Planctomycetota bacterium]|nr:DUF393 domain-containing protein [Planctomycetota bacterium]